MQEIQQKFNKIVEVLSQNNTTPGRAEYIFETFKSQPLYDNLPADIQKCVDHWSEINIRLVKVHQWADLAKIIENFYIPITKYTIPLDRVCSDIYKNMIYVMWYHASRCTNPYHNYYIVTQDQTSILGCGREYVEKNIDWCVDVGLDTNTA
jgi:hypothetical protein